MKNKADEDVKQYEKTAKEIEDAEEAAYKAGADLSVKKSLKFKAKNIYRMEPTDAEQRVRHMRNQNRSITKEQAEDAVAEEVSRSWFTRGADADKPLMERVEARKRLNALKSSGGPR